MPVVAGRIVAYPFDFVFISHLKVITTANILYLSCFHESWIQKPEVCETVAELEMNFDYEFCEYWLRYCSKLEPPKLCNRKNFSIAI